MLCDFCWNDLFKLGCPGKMVILCLYIGTGKTKKILKKLAIFIMKVYQPDLISRPNPLVNMNQYMYIFNINKR